MAIKRINCMHATTWMNLENIVLSESKVFGEKTFTKVYTVSIYSSTTGKYAETESRLGTAGDGGEGENRA